MPVEVKREGIRLVERREAENEARLEALRDTARAGISDIAEGRFKDFDRREAVAGPTCRIGATRARRTVL